MDINKNRIINDTVNFAIEKGIKVITSTPWIELWFLLHFEYTTANLTNNEVIKRLRKYYPKYEKNINLFPYIHDNVEFAIGNSLLYHSLIIIS